MFLHIEKHVKTRVGSSLALPHKFFALKRVELLCCLFVSSGLSCVFLLLCLKICRVLEKIIHGVSILTLASFFSLMILIWLSVLIEISFVLYHSYCITFKQLWHFRETHAVTQAVCPDLSLPGAPTLSSSWSSMVCSAQNSHQNLSRYWDSGRSQPWELRATVSQMK